jgi:hypothetical protein
VGKVVAATLPTAGQQRPAGESLMVTWRHIGSSAAVGHVRVLRPFQAASWLQHRGAGRAGSVGHRLATTRSSAASRVLSTITGRRRRARRRSHAPGRARALHGEGADHTSGAAVPATVRTACPTASAGALLGGHETPSAMPAGTTRAHPAAGGGGPGRGHDRDGMTTWCRRGCRWGDGGMPRDHRPIVLPRSPGLAAVAAAAVLLAAPGDREGCAAAGPIRGSTAIGRTPGLGRRAVRCASRLDMANSAVIARRPRSRRR